MTCVARNGRFICIVGVAVALAAATIRADVPRVVHYQGKLVTNAGGFVAGPVSLRLRLYNHPVNSSPVLFDETYPTVTLSNGLFSLLLGSATAGGVPDSVLSGSLVYLSVSVNGAAELSPRSRVDMAPFAGKAKSAEQLVKPGTSSTAVAVAASGQVAIGAAAPANSALLDLVSTTGGLAPPRMTEAQRDAIATPVPGLLIFNTTTGCYNMWSGSTWKQSCFECTFTSPVAGNNGPICEGDTLNLSSTTVAGATYAWTGPNGFTSNLQNPSVASATSAASGPYSVRATLNGCTSTAVTTLATVAAIPLPPTISNNGPICVGQALQFTASTVPGAVYNWTGPNSFTSNDQNPVIATATAAANGVYNVTVTSSGCTSPPASTTAVVSSIPAAPGPISGQTTVCSNTGNYVYSISDVSGATSYTWTAPSGATITNGQGTAFATVSFGNSSGNVGVTASNMCGSSGATTLAITVQGSSSSQTFSYTGVVADFTVPTCVSTVTIEAWGASGGNGYAGTIGGKGARMRGTFSPVTPGQVLRVLVGGQGTSGSSNYQGGGGGGSFVWNPSDTTLPLIAAGGGGGAGYSNGSGVDAVSTANGTNGRACGAGAGVNGNGGGSSGSTYSGAGGAGWLGNGSTGNYGGSNCPPQAVGGTRPLAGGQGGAYGGTGTYGGSGGFGGGGGSQGVCTAGPGGGGGGYSGGGGGGTCTFRGAAANGGGGAGSYNGGTNQSNSSGDRTGNGQVIISW